MITLRARDTIMVISQSKGYTDSFRELEGRVGLVLFLVMDVGFIIIHKIVFMFDVLFSVYISFTIKV